MHLFPLRSDVTHAMGIRRAGRSLILLNHWPFSPLAPTHTRRGAAIVEVQHAHAG